MGWSSKKERRKVVLREKKHIPINGLVLLGKSEPETIDFPMKKRGFPVIFFPTNSLIPIDFPIITHQLVINKPSLFHTFPIIHVLNNMDS